MDIKRYLPLLILVCFLVYSFKDVSVFVDEISKFLIWVDSLGYIAPLVVFAIHSLAIMICFPLSIMFEWGSGFLFGLVGGSCIILLSKSFGALLCFVLGRYLLREKVEAWVSQIQNQYFQNIYAHIGRDQGAWKLAVLLRLSPVPSWLNNYGLAITPIPLHTFLMANLAALPMIIQNAYVGTLFQSAASISLSTASANRNPLWVNIMMVVGFLSTILISKLMVNYATTSMQEIETEPELFTTPHEMNIKKSSQYTSLRKRSHLP